MKRLLLLALAITAFFLPTNAFAAADLEITNNSIRFSKETLIAGDEVRVYAKVRNRGDVDASGYVFFYSGLKPIGPSQIVSIPAGGTADEVWVDFVIPYSNFNISAELKGVEPEDTNSQNNSGLTYYYTPVVDDDRDGIDDSIDNCESANADQSDQDGDGIGDACDEDFAVEEEPEPEPEVEEQVQPLQAVQQEEQEERVTASEPTIIQKLLTKEEKSQVEDIAEELDQVELDKRFADGVLSLSVNANFLLSKIDWSTFEFIALDSGIGDSTYAWDFGDGATSNQERIAHTFPKPGKYTVTLTVTGEDGTTVQDTEEISISFFHFANPFLIAVIVALIVIIFAGIGMIGLGKRKER